MKRFSLVLLIVFALLLAACQPVATETAAEMPMEAEGPMGKVEVFSWWSGGGELAGLDAIIVVFNERYPDLEFDNAAIGGGDGVNMKTVLETRMLGGEPPDSFQVWAGEGVVQDHVVSGRMEGLDFLYSEEGLYDVFPQAAIDNVSYEGTPYVVPVNIHRQNVMWYRIDKFEAAGITEPPKTWDEFFVAAEKLQEAGIPAIGGASSGALSFHTYNYFLNSVTDGETYLGLFDGSVGWDTPEVAEALALYKRALEYASDDWLEVGWETRQSVLWAISTKRRLSFSWATGSGALSSRRQPRRISVGPTFPTIRANMSGLPTLSVFPRTRLTVRPPSPG